MTQELAKTMPETRYGVEQLYMLGARVRRVDLLDQAHTLAKQHKMFVTASYAQGVLQTFGHEENMSASHAILPRVIDWWGIRSWGTPAQKCYYTKFEDDLSNIIKHIPPPPPNLPMA